MVAGRADIGRLAILVETELQLEACVAAIDTTLGADKHWSSLRRSDLISSQRPSAAALLLRCFEAEGGSHVATMGSS